MPIVNLGNQGLGPGDVIDGFLEDYWRNGNEVEIPAGEYQYDGEGLGIQAEEATLIGQGNVVFNRAGTGVEARPTIEAVDGGEVVVKNITIRGRAGQEQSRTRLEAEDNSSVLVENYNKPDGSVDDSDSIGFYSPPGHEGLVTIRNCEVQWFGNNGVYTDSPGDPDDGEGGQVIVEGGLFKNNNIANVRLGSDNSILRHAAIVVDQETHESLEGGTNARGLRIRNPGDNLVVKDVHIFYSDDAPGDPISINDEAAGGSAVMEDIFIRNDSGNRPIRMKTSDYDITGQNWHITGSGELVGDMDEINVSNVCRGTGCTEPQTAKLIVGEVQPPSDGGGFPQDAKLFEIVSQDNGSIDYTFRADGEIRKAQSSDQVGAGNNDTINDNLDGTYNATGHTGNTGWGDAYLVDGRILSFTRLSGNAEIVTRWAGQEFDINNLDEFFSEPDDGQGGNGGNGNGGNGGNGGDSPGGNGGQNGDQQDDSGGANKAIVGTTTIIGGTGLLKALFD